MGGWNCDKNRDSRDAIVILDIEGNLVGKPWRGNIRKTIEDASDTADWLTKVFQLCNAKSPDERSTVTMAIDAPLGFPSGFRKLINGEPLKSVEATSSQNSYLFRKTERLLANSGRTPLSAVKDMIGSQATKAMHAVAKFAAHRERCGVWKGANGYTMIETYPAACEGSKEITKILNRESSPLGHKDKDDARICAAVAWLFANQQQTLNPPPECTPQEEGWIWVPNQLIAGAVGHETGANAHHAAEDEPER